MSGSVGRMTAAVLFALAVSTASLVQNGEVLLRRGYGLANLEHRVAITPSTVFDIASVSKQFTGLAISILVHTPTSPPASCVRFRSGTPAPSR